MTLWGGRFADRPSEVLWRFTASVADRRLLVEDVEGSIAHVEALVHAGVVTAEVGERLLEGLHVILDEAGEGGFTFSASDEDVHTAVERRLGELIGETAGMLHTGRSRNDQVALDVRLYLRRAARSRVLQIGRLIRALARQADDAGETIVPSYTHLQQAQAVPFGHHLLAHGWALVRDAERFLAALERIEVSPLGAGAGGGSRLPLDPGYAAERLGLRGTFDNSLDAVASRDAVSEYLYCCTQTLVDLSRLSEELVLWGSAEFGWATYADRHTTGSSALPHKKNPDAAELARAKAGSAIGDLAGILAVQKGLPLAYNRDLQQDKEHLFRVDTDLEGALDALAGMVAEAVFHPPPPDPVVAVLDLAEVLVERGVPFREAHEAIGRLVAEAAGRGIGPGELPPAELAAFHEALRPDDARLLDPVESVRARRSPGGGSFSSVQHQLESLAARLDALEQRSA